MERAKPAATGSAILCQEKPCSHQRTNRQGTTTTESAEWAIIAIAFRAQGPLAVSCSRRLMVLSNRLKDRRFTGSIIVDTQASGQRSSALFGLSMKDRWRRNLRGRVLSTNFKSSYHFVQGKLNCLLVRHDLPLEPLFRIILLVFAESYF